MSYELSAAVYLVANKSFSPWLDGRGSGNIDVLSLAYKGDGSGIYQSVYYSPMAHVAAEKLGYA